MLGREVALKMLHPQLTIQPQFLERFKKEAQGAGAAASSQHQR